MIYGAFWLKIVSVICYTTENLFRIKYNTWCCEELKSPLFVKCLNWWSIIYIDVYLHFSGRAGYITKQPLLINLMGMFAAITASTNILFFFIPVCRSADSLVFHFSLHWEHRFHPINSLILGQKIMCYLLRKINVLSYAAFQCAIRNQLLKRNLN